VQTIFNSTMQHKFYNKCSKLNGVACLFTLSPWPIGKMCLSILWLLL